MSWTITVRKRPTIDKAMNILTLIGRSQAIFEKDTQQRSDQIKKIICDSRFLVLGAAGTIGQAVTKEIFKENPKKLHLVDISENNLVELVRDLRSTFGYISGDFQALPLDIGSIEYDAFFENDGQYDYVLNLSALKHVRSEKDPYTLMRMIDVNILNTEKTLEQSINKGVKKYFCVSTDKAANPVNMMGASKKIMEMFLAYRSSEIVISTARFANVAYSDGSLLHSFKNRIEKGQPIVAPDDIQRYFVTPKESGQLCLMSCLFGDNRDIFFPKLHKELDLVSFADIAKAHLKEYGLEPLLCSDENQARALAKNQSNPDKWPCLFTSSDTTGEKPVEEFYTEFEELDLSRFDEIGIIKTKPLCEEAKINNFKNKISEMKREKHFEKSQLIKLFTETLPSFKHLELGKNLDSKM